MTAERQKEIDRMVSEQRQAKAQIDAGDTSRMKQLWLEDSLSEECCLRLEAELEISE